MKALLDNEQLQEVAHVLEVAEVTLNTIHDNHPAMASVIQSGVARASVDFFNALAEDAEQYSPELAALVVDMRDQVVKTIGE